MLNLLKNKKIRNWAIGVVAVSALAWIGISFSSTQASASMGAFAGSIRGLSAKIYTLLYCKKVK